MAWIDYKKTYDMVPHSWIITTLEMFGVADNMIDLMSRSMTKWRTNLYSNGECLDSVNINRGIFQRLFLTIVVCDRANTLAT